MSEAEYTDVTAAKEQLRELLLEFAACLDEHRWDDLPRVFTPDGGIRLPKADVFGAEALRAGPAQDLTRYVLTQHLVGYPRVRIDGTSATVRANVIGTHVMERGEPDRIGMVGGRYDCVAVLSDEGWRMRTIEPTYLWLSGEPMTH